MRIRRRLTQCMIAAALLCAAACSSANDEPPSNAPTPVSNEAVRPAGRNARVTATPKPTATESASGEQTLAGRPIAVIIKKDSPNTTYSKLKDEIDRLSASYKDKVDFKYLDMNSSDPYNYPGVKEHPQFKEIQKFYAQSQAHSGTAAIFKPGDSNPIQVDSEKGGIARDPNEYGNEFKQKLDAALTTPLAATPTLQTPPVASGGVGGGLAGGKVRWEDVEGTPWTTGGLGLAAIVGLSLLAVLALIVGALSLLLIKSVSSELKGLHQEFDESKQAAREWREKANDILAGLTKKPSEETLSARSTTPNGDVPGELRNQLVEQGRRLDDVIGRLNGLDDSLKRIDSQEKQILVQTISWLGRLHTMGVGADGDSGGEAERAALLTRLEGYAGRLHSLAGQVEPLTNEMANLVQSPAVAAFPALRTRVQKLYEEIRRFEDAESALAEKLQALRNGSYGERRARFASAMKELEQRLNDASPAQFIKEYRGLYEEHFPYAPKDGGAQPLDVDDIGQLVSGAQDYLMDWFSDYTELLSQTQAAAASAQQTTDGVMDELSRVHAVAREVLRAFDILPVEIQVGQTAYDHRLFDMAMTRATAQYPANTIIEVQRTGFRRMSTGEVLRRPQVIVSGAAV